MMRERWDERLDEKTVVKTNKLECFSDQHMQLVNMAGNSLHEMKYPLPN